LVKAEGKIRLLRGLFGKFGSKKINQEVERNKPKPALKSGFVSVEEKEDRPALICSQVFILFMKPSAMTMVFQS
jgi:hypothetical protein